MNKPDKIVNVAKSGKYFLLVIALLYTSLSTEAQKPEVRISVDKNRILIGEPFTYRIDASFPLHAFKVQFPALPDSFNHFEMVKKGTVVTTEANGMLNCSQVFSFTSFDSGTNTFPPLPMLFHSPGSDKDSPIKIFTDSMLISVNYSPLDSVKTFHDIKSIIEVKDEWPWWMWAALGLSIILLLVLLYSLFKNRRRKKPKTIFTSRLSPIEEARQSLKELEKQQLLFKGEVKQFHTRLSEIFKRYLSRKTNTNLLHLTSDEVLMHLDSLKITKDIISVAANNLRMGDAVKFAKFIPPGEESNQALMNSNTVIEKIDLSPLNSTSDI
ncbi:MAG: hypothetical protein ABJA57_00325 [Ginsengibacter sp.]